MTYPLDEVGGAKPDETPVVGRRRAVVVLLSVVLVAVLVGLVAVVELRGFGGGSKRPAGQDPPAVAPIAPIGGSAPPSDEPAPPSTAPTTGPIPTGTHEVTAPPTPTGCTTACEMPGDGTVPVGGADPEAVRAGTYHSDGPTRADGCLWWLATDPQGNNQKAGRTVDHATDVIVKDGLRFHSEGCKVWRLVGPV